MVQAGACIFRRRRLPTGPPRPANGSYDEQTGGYLLLCGSTLSLGSGSLFSAGTWQATKCTGCTLECQYAADGYCDEPVPLGTGLCYLGTDPSDCCSTPKNGICDDASQGGRCTDGRDYYDCGTCPYTNDGACDEVRGICPPGSDAVDCGGAAQP